MKISQKLEAVILSVFVVAAFLHCIYDWNNLWAFCNIAEKIFLVVKDVCFWAVALLFSLLISHSFADWVNDKRKKPT